MCNLSALQSLTAVLAKANVDKKCCRRLTDLAIVESEQASEGQQHFLSTLALASTAVSDFRLASCLQA